jgi:surfactin synthase thioesterase subunit
MLTDAHAIFKGFAQIMKKEGFVKSMFVMGRSLGSMPAIEVAFNYQDQLKGLIIESGTANNLRRFWDYLPEGQKQAQRPPPKQHPHQRQKPRSWRRSSSGSTRSPT